MQYGQEEIWASARVSKEVVRQTLIDVNVAISHNMTLSMNDLISEKPMKQSDDSAWEISKVSQAAMQFWYGDEARVEKSLRSCGEFFLGRAEESMANDSQKKKVGCAWYQYGRAVSEYPGENLGALKPYTRSCIILEGLFAGEGNESQQSGEIRKSLQLEARLSGLAQYLAQKGLYGYAAAIAYHAVGSSDDILGPGGVKRFTKYKLQFLVDEGEDSKAGEDLAQRYGALVQQMKVDGLMLHTLLEPENAFYHGDSGSEELSISLLQLEKSAYQSLALAVAGITNEAEVLIALEGYRGCYLAELSYYAAEEAYAFVAKVDFLRFLSQLAKALSTMPALLNTHQSTLEQLLFEVVRSPGKKLISKEKMMEGEDKASAFLCRCLGALRDLTLPKDDGKSSQDLLQFINDVTIASILRQMSPPTDCHKEYVSALRILLPLVAQDAGLGKFTLIDQKLLDSALFRWCIATISDYFGVAGPSVYQVNVHVCNKKNGIISFKK